jgi:hypothetical protein
MRKTQTSGSIYSGTYHTLCHTSDDYLAPYFRLSFYGIYTAQVARFSGIRWRLLWVWWCGVAFVFQDMCLCFMRLLCALCSLTDEERTFTVFHRNEQKGNGD